LSYPLDRLTGFDVQPPNAELGARYWRPAARVSSLHRT
jgi:hypothetical protein